MTNLNDIQNQVEEFLEECIRRFRDEYKTINSIGIYCCPWAGWLSSNLNINKTIEETQSNCPDFEFVEFGLLELPMLSKENDKENASFVLNKQYLTVEKKNGDEGLNKIVFEFLKPIGQKIKFEQNIKVLLQMLDSKYVEKL